MIDGNIFPFIRFDINIGHLNIGILKSHLIIIVTQYLKLKCNEILINLGK